MPNNASPFAITTTKPLVAIKGNRGGYIQLATSTYTNTYDAQPISLFEAANAWAAIVEGLGAQKVYWIILSEAVDHKHIHLYPRWPEDELSALDLFSNRVNDEKSPLVRWNATLEDKLSAWSNQFEIELI